MAANLLSARVWLGPVLLTCICAPAVSAARTTLDAKKVRAYAEHTLAQWQVPGLAVAVVQNGQPVLIEGYGGRELGGTTLMDADTLFTIASLTKAFTAAAAAVAVDRKQIAWDEPIAKALPEFRLYDQYVTAHASFRDLLCHRVGTNQHYDNGMAFTRAQMIQRLAVDTPIAPFRAAHVYHNILYSAAGEAVARRVGTAWEQHVRDVLLEPLGMTSTSIGAHELASAPNRASSHLRSRAGVLQPDPFRPDGWWSMDNHAPAGAINSTARDMARWLEFQLGDGTFRGARLLSEEALRETHTTQIVYHERYYEPFEPVGYGLGWEVVLYGGRQLLWHTGTFRGQVSVAILAPESRTGIFVFANSRDADYGMMHVAVAQWILDRLLGRPEHDWSKDSRREYVRLQAEREQAERELFKPAAMRAQATARLQDYVGTYTSAEWGTYSVRLEGGALRIDREQSSEPYFAHLEHWNADTYRASWNETVAEYEPAQLVSFVLDDAGKVRSVRFVLAGDDEVTELRRTSDTALSQAAPLPQTKVAKIEALVRATMAAHKVPGASVAVATGGHLQWSAGFGLADVENAVPATEHTRYRTASIAKWMTATAAMRLAEEGKLDLEAPVQRYCPAYPQKQWPIKVRHLLNHTAGVRHYRGDNDEPNTTPAQQAALAALIRKEQSGQYTRYTDALAPVAAFKDDPLLFEPGTRYHYTSLGYRLLGCVLEGASGGSYRELMQRAVFEPSAMTATVADDAFAIIGARAAGYILGENQELRRADYRDVSDNLPAGGYLATAADLVRFALAFDANQLVSAQSSARMQAMPALQDVNPREYYGFGVRVLELDKPVALRGRRVLLHSGGQAGVDTRLMLLPAEHMAVAVMLNLEEGPVDALALDIAAELLEPPPALNARTQPGRHPSPRASLPPR